MAVAMVAATAVVMAAAAVTAARGAVAAVVMAVKAVPAVMAEKAGNPVGGAVTMAPVTTRATITAAAAEPKPVMIAVAVARRKRVMIAVVAARRKPVMIVVVAAKPRPGTIVARRRAPMAVATMAPPIRAAATFRSTETEAAERRRGSDPPPRPHSDLIFT